MATASPQNTKLLYSWWWNSHISPKNSKWLQETLSDMDNKISQMIKLLEEDADSFARRAEMYYKQRPELLKLVEEFYRSYRSLAERYDNATTVLRQAHRSMAEAFPSQVPLSLPDDSPSGSDPRTPEVSPGYPPTVSDTSGSLARKYAAFPAESGSVGGRRGLKKFNDMFESGGKARKVLSFEDAQSQELDGEFNGSHQSKMHVDSERLNAIEQKYSTLKNDISKVEGEREAALVQYQKALEKLSAMEADVRFAKNESKGYAEKAVKAEEELRATLSTLAREQESAQVQCHDHACKISELENAVYLAKKDSSEAEARVGISEMEVKTLKQELERLEYGKEDALLRHRQLLEKISELEAKLQNALQDARSACERAEKAEMDAGTSKQESEKLRKENESASEKYLQCLQTTGLLESQLDDARKEKQKLMLEIDKCIAKLNVAEERCHNLESLNDSMHSEVASLSKKVEAQGTELMEKQQELTKIWNSLEEERMRFMEAETAFQTLQHLNSQCQMRLSSLTAELQNRDRMLEDLETYNQRLKHEVEHITNEHKGLNEAHLSSAVAIQDLGSQNIQLKDTIGKLESEVDLRVDQRNALQQDIYCLKEVINEHKKNYQAITWEVESLGFSPENFSSRVKDLMDDNSRLKGDCERFIKERDENMQKLSVMEKHVQENLFLTNSLSDLNVELETVRDKVKVLEESCQSLLGEKSTLIIQNTSLASQLLATNDNLVNVMEHNGSLNKFLHETQNSLESLQINVRHLEDLCTVLENERSSLVKELDVSKTNLQGLKFAHKELEDRNISLEKKNESLLQDVQELRACYGVEQQTHENLKVKSKDLENSCLLLENEKSVLHERNQKLVGDMESFGFSSDNFASRLQEMIEENAQLKEGIERGRRENVVLVEKLSIMDKHVEEKTLLMKSLSDLDNELETVRNKVVLLEEYCQSLLGEKSAVVAQKASLASELHISNANLVNAMEKNSSLEKSLVEERASFDTIQEKLKSSEEKCSMLENEKSNLHRLKETVILELEDTKRSLESWNLSYRELEDKKIFLENEKDALLCEVEELRACFGAEKQEHDNLKVKSKGLEDSYLFLEKEKLEFKDKHYNFIAHVESVGFTSDNFASRLKQMMGENIQLKEDRDRTIEEKVALVERLSIMDKLVEENALLTGSLSELNVTLESVKKNAKMSEEYFQKSLGKERSSVELLRIKVNSLESLCPVLQNLKSNMILLKEYLIMELDASRKCLETLSAHYIELHQKKIIVEKEKEALLNEVRELKDSSDVEKQLHDKLVEKVKILEDSMLFLCSENFELAVVKDCLTSLLKDSEENLKTVNGSYKKLEEKYVSLERHKNLVFQELGEVKNCLAMEKRERTHLSTTSESKVAGLAFSISKLQEELWQNRKRLDTEADGALHSQIENLVLEETMRAASRKNMEFQKLVETLPVLEKIVLNLENENAKQKLEMTLVFDELNLLKQTLYQVLKILDAKAEDAVEKDKDLVSLVLIRIDETQEFLGGLSDDNQKLVIENSLFVTLLREIQSEVENIVNTKTVVQQELDSKCKELSFWRSEGIRLSEEKDELKVKIFEGKQRETDREVKLDNVQKLLLDLQGVHLNLQGEQTRVLDEHKGLLNSVSGLMMEKDNLTEEWLGMLFETLFQGTFLLVLKNAFVQGTMALTELADHLDKALTENGALKENAVVMGTKLEELNSVKLKLAECVTTVEQIRNHCKEVEVVQACLQAKIVSRDGDMECSTCKTINHLEVLQILEDELLKLQLDFNAIRDVMNMLNNELQSKMHEAKTWEAEAESLFGEHQSSMVYIALLEGKISDLSELYAKLEQRNHSAAIEIDCLKERVDHLDADRETANTCIRSHVSAAVSLLDVLTHLETRIANKKEFMKIDEQSQQDTCEESLVASSDAPMNFQELQTRLKNVETTVVENERRLMLENQTACSKLQESLKQIEELKFQIDSLQVMGRSKSADNRTNGVELKSKQHKDVSEAAPKDIVLDQISEASSYGISKVEILEDDDQMLRLWETTNQAGSFNTFVSKRSGSFASMDSLSQELSVDKLEISKTFSGSFWDGKKILERLNSDEEKLSILNGDVQDLKRKVEVAEKNKKGKDIEYQVVKEQLKESEEAIKRLSESTKKLKRTVEDDLPTFDEKALQSSGQAVVVKRRKVSTQARRGSEKIGRVQFEVKKLQLLLTQVDDANTSKGKATVIQRNSRVPLRDFLYGKTRTENGIRYHFCSCLRPKSEGD